MSFPKDLTIGSKYGPAMEIADQAEADAYFERCVEHTMTHWHKTRTEAENIERHNIGYYAGYFSHAVRARVETLFRCKHPFFGAVADGVPSTEEIFKMGYEMAAKRKEEV